jgi:hypothetical protein
MGLSKIININIAAIDSEQTIALAASEALHQVKGMNPVFEPELRCGNTGNWQLDGANNYSLWVREDGYYLFCKYDLPEIINKVVTILESKFCNG